MAIMAGICRLAPEIIGAAWIAALLMFFRHRENIDRLMKHKEPM
jgi:glycerol-3-phosphate acyltransferase PlsY